MSNFYESHAAELSASYNALRPEDVHAPWWSLLQERIAGFACDIGAGSGRDANWLAEKGWDVIAVEPSTAMREEAASTAHPNVTWLDDSLPELKTLRAMGHRFDLVLLSAVWMHVAPGSRERAFRIVTELLKPGGLLVITLRHGEDEEENRQRGFHPVSAEELEQLARSRAIVTTQRDRLCDKAGRQHVSWETLVFSIPDDGTGGLPLLRHVIVNDSKFASYKLGLLRVLTRIAETLPGIVIRRTDDYVDIPFGVVGLYWLKLYKPLVLEHRIQVTGNPRKGLGFAKDAFYQLDSISAFDLRLGSRLDVDHATILTQAIKDACVNIKKMPASRITWPGTENLLFLVQLSGFRHKRSAEVISPEYLARFGTMRVPAFIWQTLGQYACWLEPAIIREWVSLTDSWSVGETTTEARVFDWEETRRDTRVAHACLSTLRGAGQSVRCVWSNQQLRVPHIDHCFPWSRWFNNDLWNLFPTTSEVNRSKGDRLPAAQALSDARERIEHWWQTAYLDSPWRERFQLEASSSLPGLTDTPSGQDIYHAMRHQRARLKADQQLAEWTFGGA